MKLFVDTWGWLTLRDRRAAKHEELVWITPKRFTEIQNLRLKLQDKPNISFTNLTSMVVMGELGVNRILTGDAHFTHVGMGFEITP